MKNRKAKKTFTVDNQAPELEISLEKQKAADIVYTYGNASKEQLSLYENAAKQLEQKLKDQGINTKVSAISSSTITAKDSFLWKEYEHPGYKDAYGAYRDHHIVAEGDNITMYGYCARGFRDFLYIPEEEKGSRTISFDLQRDQTDWHSMEGAGLLFQTQIDETTDRINGFCLLVTQEGLQLIEIQDARLSTFRNGGGSSTKQFGRLLRTFPLENLYDNHHLKIELDNRSVSVWDGDAKIVDSYLLPDTQKGHGYGLITCYKEHSCEQQSYFTFSNVIMSAISGKQLSDMLDDYAWRDGAARYVVHLSNEPVGELKGEEAVCDMAKVLIEKGVHFFGIGNETNQSQFEQLLFTGEISGSIYQESQLKTALSSIGQIIEAGAAAQDTSTDPFISSKDRIQYVSLYTDKENDPLKTISFEYQYDPNIFVTGKGNKRYLSAPTPIEQFELAGAYQIWAKAQDDPTKGNQALGSYCKWSGIKEMEKLLLVQSKPVAKVEVTLTENPKDSAACLTNIEYESYDPDYDKDDKSAIIEEHFYYKNTKDAGWTKGRLPKQLPIGETYLVKYQVKDQQRSLSDPAIAVVKTNSMIKWQEPEDNEAPKVYITLSKDKAEAGEQVQIDAWASDDIGVDTFSLKIDGKEVLNDYGRCYQTKDKEGEVTITATAKDISGNETTETRTITFEDNRDYQAPVITITAPKSGNDIAARTEIAGSITDDRELKNYKVYVRKQGSEDYILLKSGSEPVEDDTIALWDTTSLSEGVYEIHISAEDMSGNTMHYGIAVEVIHLEEETGQPEEKGDEEAPYIEYKEVRLSKESNEVIISGTVTDNKELKEYTITCRQEGEEEKTLFTGTQEVKEGILVTIPAETLTEGTYTITTRAEDAEGNYSLRSMNFTYKQFSEGSSETDLTLPSEPVKTEGEGSASSDAIKKPALAITLNRLAAGINESILGIITADEGIDKSTLTVTVTDEDGKEETPEIKNQYISILTTKTGTLTFTVTAKNNQGETITADAQCQVYDQSDKTKPTAKLITPEPDAIVSEPTDIIGTAKDEKALSCYRLELAPKGSSDFITLKESTKQVENAALGRLDTTTFTDGSYSLRLTVQDKGGNRVSVTRSIIIESGLKLGAMNVGFTDLKETVSGVGLSVTRSYNSQNKTSSDFGYGWTLGLSGIKVYKTNSFSEYWVMSKSGSLLSTRYTMAETARHDIIIRYEDGSSDRFQAVLDPAQQAFAPICSTRISFVSATNKKRKLAIDGDNLALTSQCLGENYLFGDDEDTMFEPENFILTMEDNTQIYLNVDKGVTRMKDAHGNTVKVTKNGYEHSDGKGITFTRDEKDRIVKATDTAGNELHYAYNEAGDLISYTDKAGSKVEYSYDGEHNLIAIKDPMGIAVARNEYDENGRLVAIIDAKGNRTEYDYQTDKNSQIVTDALGGISSYSYDKKGNILSETNALGNKTTYTYDKDGNRTSVTDAKGNKTTYQYDEKGNQTRVIYPDKTQGISTYNNTNMVTSISTLNKELCHISYDDTDSAEQLTDALGNETDYTYNAKGNLRSVTDEIGTVKQFTYDKDGNVKTITDGNGTAATMTYDKDGNCLSVTTKEQTEQGEQTCTRSYTYDESGNQVTSTDPEGNVTTYAYDADGRKTAETDAKGRTTHYSYDEAGNQTGITYADGTSETFTYDALGNNITATARNGQTQTMEYDALGNITVLTDELGNQTTYEYDAAGNLTKETEASGAVTTYEYDSRNRNTKITDALGGVTRYTYTENSQIETVTDALGGETRYTYDDNGNCIKTTYADGTKVQAAYDARGRRTSQTDALGNTTKYAYDGADHLIQVTDAMGNDTHYTYDGTGSLTSVTDALGSQTTYEYDSNGRITRTTNAMGQTMTQEYDALGNITRQESYGKTITKNTYDSNNRLAETKITGKEGEETDTTSYQYNKLGQVTKVTDASGTITYSYDKHSRLSKKTDVNGNTVSYSYDSLGRTAAVITPYGTTSYEYDLLDRVSKVTDREGSVAGYTYDAIGNRKTVTYENGITTSYTYDACGRLTEEQVKNKKGEMLSHYCYELDAGGNRTAIGETDSKGSETKTTYRYDKLNRITKEEITKKTAEGESTETSRLTNEYAYDAVSNRTSKTVSIRGDIEAIADVLAGISEQAEGTTTYTYNSLNQLVTESTKSETRTYSYNEEGSLIKTASSSPAGKQADYGYNLKQQLIRATLQQGSQAEIISYTYDYEGNRTGKAKDDTEYTCYVNDTQSGDTQVLAETNEKGEEQAVYTRQGSELISMAGNGKLWYYISDGHQSTRALTNEEGTVTDTYSYDAWGNLLSKTGDTVNDYLYTGEQYNAETGLYYLRARYMNPATGTFISMDSYAGNNSDPITLHKYLYANANPVMNVDPTGNYSVAECNASMALNPIAQQMYMNLLNQSLQTINSISTANADARRLYNLLQSQDLKKH